jgi:transmembrane sensor
MTDRHIDDEALDWAIRMAEPDADWDAFLTWLEGDATRSARYDRAVTMLDDSAAALALEPATTPIPEASVVRSSRRGWIGGAIAAGLAGAIGLGIWTHAPQPYAVTTAAGEQRTVTLADGSSVILAGASTVRLDHRDPRIATVERGEMLFRVRHDAARLFAVQVTDARTHVAVAEGAVMVDPDGAALRLDAGQAAMAEGTVLERRTVAVADVGGWREGRLAYDDAPIAEVAADLSRQTGRRINVAPAVATRTFRGTLAVATVKGRPALLGTLLGVTVRDDGEGWTLEPRR